MQAGAGAATATSRTHGSSHRPPPVRGPVASMPAGPRCRQRSMSSSPQVAKGLDIPGLITLTAALLLLVVPLLLGHDQHWPVWTQVCLAASPPMLGVFVLVERAVARRGGAPLVPGAVMKAPGLALGATTMFFAMAGYAGFLFSFSQHLQNTCKPGSASPRRAPASPSRHWPSVSRRAASPGRSSPSLAPADDRCCLRGRGSRLPRHRTRHELGRPRGHRPARTAVGVRTRHGCLTSPLPTVALTRVNPADAADASDLMTTSAQVAQVLGIATYGSVYVSGADRHMAHSSAHAIQETTLLVAGGLLVSALTALLPARRARRHHRLRQTG